MVNKKAIYIVVGIIILALIVWGVVSVINNSGVRLSPEDEKATGLKTQPKTGNLFVSSNPSGANIYLDGVYKGLTPYTVTGLNSKIYAVNLTKTGYKVYQTLMFVKSNSTAVLNASLIPMLSSNPFDVTAGSDTYAQIKTSVKDGDVVIPIVYTNWSSALNKIFIGNGKDSTHLTPVYNGITNLIFNKTRNDHMMVLSWNSSTEFESYVIRFSVSSSNGINYTDVQKMYVGEWSDVCQDMKPGDTCDVGSSTITFNKVSSEYEKSVVFSLSSGASANKIFDASGKYYVQIPYINNQAGPIYIQVKETGTNNVVKTFIVSFDPMDAGNKIMVK